MLHAACFCLILPARSVEEIAFNHIQRCINLVHHGVIMIVVLEIRVVPNYFALATRTWLPQMTPRTSACKKSITHTVNI
jgi:hypothetical protein